MLRLVPARSSYGNIKAKEFVNAKLPIKLFSTLIKFGHFNKNSHEVVYFTEIDKISTDRSFIKIKNESRRDALITKFGNCSTRVYFVTIGKNFEAVKSNISFSIK